jgi:predicted anti-sigma-YlaC factor YlaD
MSEHIQEWLNAYLDGELSGARLRQVESHLADCGICRAELDELQQLSALLHDTAPAGDFLSTERFVANLTLNLPRQPERTSNRRALEIGWWLIPVSVLGIWVFVQVTLALSAVFQAASTVGLFGETFAWIGSAQPQMNWFATLTGLFGDQLGLTSRFALSALNEAEVSLRNWVGPYLWQALLGVIYLGWLASWWFRQPGQAANVGTLGSPSHS